MELDRLQVWSWAGEYVQPATDGTQWSLELAWAGQVVQASGDNGYPPANGDEDSPTWVLFCAAISALAGFAIA